MYLGKLNFKFILKIILQFSLYLSVYEICARMCLIVFLNSELKESILNEINSNFFLKVFFMQNNWKFGDVC